MFNTAMTKLDFLQPIEDWLALYFGKKAPAMPKKVKEFIVKYGPYLSLVLLVFAFPVMLAAFGVSTFLTPFSIFRGLSLFAQLSTLIALSTFILQVLALPGLFKRTQKGWYFSFYASLLTALHSLITSNLGSLIIQGLLVWYVLFQIKSYYKN